MRYESLQNEKEFSRKLIPQQPNLFESMAEGLRSVKFVSIDPSARFVEGAAIWLRQHAQYVKPSTLHTYKKYVKALTLLMGELPLDQIHIGHIRAYQHERAKTICAYLINGELSCLQMILKEAGLWEEIQPQYQPLKVPKRRGGHSLNAKEEQALRDIAFTKPKWRLAANCMIVMLSTTMGFGELRHLRRRDVDMRDRRLTVREGAKNDYRDRTIPLNHAAYDAMQWILDRWRELGGEDDSQYILPHRPRTRGGAWIFDEPMLSIASAFKAIRKAAGLTHFRLYDCRVQAITKLLSNPAVSPQVAKEIAGHISQAMQDRYSIQLFDTKLAALEALESPERKQARAEKAELRVVAGLSQK